MRFQAAVLLGIVIATDGPSTRSKSSGHEPGSGHAAHLRSEARRLQAHFDSVLVELEERNVEALRPGQRAARATLAGWLREYRDSGVFPFNAGFAAQAVPIFRDHRGVLCAMAFLIARSGRQDMVDRIAQTRNLALIAELGQDAGLASWLDSAGLSLAEAGRIQPSYEPPPGTVFKEDAVSSSYALGSIVVSGTAIGTGFLNLAKPTRTGGLLGLVAGAGATVLGLGNLDGDNAATARVAIANVAIGSAALVIGLRSLLKANHRTSELRLTNHRRITLSPVILARESKLQPGLGLRLGF